MKAGAHEMVIACARSLAGRAHTVDVLHEVLFQLALDIVTPWPACLDIPRTMRRMPIANEVLPRHQRATWARGKTVYDVGDD